MIYVGDFPTSHTAVCIPFASFAASTGASSATSNFANTDVLIYKNGGTTQRTSASGITVSTSFDSQTGLNMIVIDLSDNTDAGFYVAGAEYQVGVADITVDSQTVRFWAGTFSIERAGGILAVLKSATFGLSALKTLIDTVDDFVDTEVAAIKTDTTAIKAKTDSLTFTAANILDANVVNWKGSTAPAMTGDAFARLGAPAGASVSADVAAVKAVDDAIKAKTDNLPVDPADASDIAASFATVNTKLDTIDDFVDTEIGTLGTKVDEIHQIHGLHMTNNLVVTPTSRTVGTIAQTISGDGITTSTIDRTA